MTPNSDRGDSDLEGLDPYDLMDVEADRLDGFFATLDDAGWQQPSRCEGWSRARRARAPHRERGLQPRVPRRHGVARSSRELGARGVTDLNGANELGIRDLDDVAHT